MSQDANAYLAISGQFRLGALPTESPHPLTTKLSFLSQNHPDQAHQILQQVDSLALQMVIENQLALRQLDSLRLEVNETLRLGGRVFMGGCGATGRLSLICEVLWRHLHTGLEAEQVIGFMAGGDTALIRSIENFEDHPEYGERQLLELGFKAGDLFVGITEGGETPFVIGATETALKISSRAPWFLYCNPDDILAQVAERSARVLHNHRIQKINLHIGPMALAGSTRMQASTILLSGVAYCLGLDSSIYEAKKEPNSQSALDFFTKLHSLQASLDYASLTPLTLWESNLYQNQENVLVVLDGPSPHFAISVLQDTTERAPTFSLVPFENIQDSNSPLSLCYLLLQQYHDSQSAWHSLLKRPPRSLNWGTLAPMASLERLYGFDISASLDGPANRRPKNQRLQLVETPTGFNFQWKENTLTYSLPNSLLLRHLVLKMLMNSHSTCVMGRLERYQSNVMTYVRASNNKLIDRAIRCAALLLAQEAKYPSYASLAQALFQIRDGLKPGEALVPELVRSF